MPEWMNVASMTLVVNVLFLVVATISVYGLYKQIRNTHEWNRRKATYEFLVDMGKGTLAEVRNRIRRHANPYNVSEDYSTVTSGMENKKREELRSDVYTLLNSLEYVALAVKFHVLNEPMCYDCHATLITSFVRWSRPLIAELRKVEPRILIECINLAEQWSQRLAKERQAEEKARLTKGEPPTG